MSDCCKQTAYTLLSGGGRGEGRSFFIHREEDVFTLDHTRTVGSGFSDPEMEGTILIANKIPFT